ncbi:hypothetical protein [Chromobacterium violaceum]|uniref:hypothetical protein n=1 Tax=Chromobacterium violaceum TaxID=536 RepID=UPI00111C47C7|nr:hypothetical protein [Chromobacterium violaceum]
MHPATMTQAAIPLSQRERVLWAQQRDDGPACFYVPRRRPDGSRNAVAMQRLKDRATAATPAARWRSMMPGTF